MDRTFKNNFLTKSTFTDSISRILLAELDSASIKYKAFKKSKINLLRKFRKYLHYNCS